VVPFSLCYALAVDAVKNKFASRLSFFTHLDVPIDRLKGSIETLGFICEQG
jgi:hypothetical protein